MIPLLATVPQYGGLWTPAEITTALWLDAADASTITIDTGVSVWADKSGNDNDAIQSTANYQPTISTGTQNGLDTLLFDGVNDYLFNITTLSLTQPLSIFVVAKTTSNAGRQYVFDGYAIITGTAPRVILALDGNDTGKPAIWSGTAWSENGATTPSGHAVYGAIFNGSVSGLSVNGTFVGSLSPGAFDLTDGIVIGANYVRNLDFLTGEIAEMVVVDSAASVDTRQKLEGYLAHKWGLENNLPANHLYKLSAPLI